MLSPRDLVDRLEPLSPEGFLYHVLNTLDEELLPLHVVPPLQQDVPLLTHEVILVHPLHYHLHALLESPIVHLLQLLVLL